MAVTGIGAALLGNKFGHPCPVHHDLGKNSCNYFCLDCQGLAQEPLCFYCRVNHPPHRILQVRKARGGQAVQAEGLYRLVDISGVYVYRINGRNLVFLNQRSSATARCPLRGIKFYVRHCVCMVCNRGLKEGFKFCSVECKVQVEPQACSVRVHDGAHGPLAMPNDEESSSMRYRSVHDVYLVRKKGRKAGTHIGCPDMGKEGGPRVDLLKASKAVVQGHSVKKGQPASARSRRKGQPVRVPFY